MKMKTKRIMKMKTRSLTLKEMGSTPTNTLKNTRTRTRTSWKKDKDKSQNKTEVERPNSPLLLYTNGEYSSVYNTTHVNFCIETISTNMSPSRFDVKPVRRRLFT